MKSPINAAAINAIRPHLDGVLVARTRQTEIAAEIASHAARMATIDRDLAALDGRDGEALKFTTTRLENHREAAKALRRALQSRDERAECESFDEPEGQIEQQRAELANIEVEIRRIDEQRAATVARLDNASAELFARCDRAKIDAAEAMERGDYEACARHRGVTVEKLRTLKIEALRSVLAIEKSARERLGNERQSLDHEVARHRLDALRTLEAAIGAEVTKALRQLAPIAEVALSFAHINPSGLLGIETRSDGALVIPARLHGVSVVDADVWFDSLVAQVIEVAA